MVLDNTIYLTHSSALSYHNNVSLVKPSQSFFMLWAKCYMWGSFTRVFNLFLLHLLFVLSDVGGVGHSVKLVPVIFVIYWRGRGEGGISRQSKYR